MCRTASTETSDDETPDEHPVNISFSDSEEPVRRSGRQRKPPVWMSSGTYELPLLLNIFRLFVILSLTQLYR
jgi:hypothetical protein